MSTPGREWRYRIVVVAALGVALGSLMSPVAQAAVDALNADKVDGKHAVGAGASIDDRKGKLVATSGTTGRLPNDIIAKAPDSERLHGLRIREVRTQWISIAADGSVYGSSPSADGIVVTHPATGTYCVENDGIIGASVAGNVQSQINGFEDLTMIVTSLYNTSACPEQIRIYTAKGGVLYDTPFTLTFTWAPPL